MSILVLRVFTLLVIKIDEYPSLLLSTSVGTICILLHLNTVYIPNSNSLLTINSCSVLQNVGFDLDLMDSITTTPGFNFMPSISTNVGLQIET